MGEHYRELFDPPEHIGVWDLDGQDRVATIVDVRATKVGGHLRSAPAAKKAEIRLKEFGRPLLCNLTNARTIAGMYGESFAAWRGKRITLYPTTTRFGPDEVACIRVRPTIPTGEPVHVGSRPVDPEVRAAQSRAAGRSTPEGDALRAARTAEDLHDVIIEHAAWIIAGYDARWPRVLELAANVGLEEASATAALEAAVQTEVRHG